jgi:hypothetical protein
MVHYALWREETKVSSIDNKRVIVASHSLISHLLVEYLVVSITFRATQSLDLTNILIGCVGRVITK